MPFPDTDNQFKEGESGNPSGRPKGSLNRSTIARKWLEAMEKAKNPITGTEADLTQEEIITLAQIAKARKGDTRAYQALMDSGYGQPKHHIEIEANQEIGYFEVEGQKIPFDKK